MTRSRSAAVAVALCLVVAACSSGDDDDGAQTPGSTTSLAEVTTTLEAPTTTVAPATTSTTAPTTGPSAGPTTPEEQAAVDAIDRWLELEDQAFTAGTTEAVIDELDALMEEGSVAVQGSLDLGGAVERTSRARIDRIWHPDDGVTGLDVCKIIETPAGEARTAHTITATDGATPFLQNETVYILERDGITCPPDDIIEPVLATYERWMELNTALGPRPHRRRSELYEFSGQEVVEAFSRLELDLAAERWLRDVPTASSMQLSSSDSQLTPTRRALVRLPHGGGGAWQFDRDGHLVAGTPGDNSSSPRRVATLDERHGIVDQLLGPRRTTHGAKNGSSLA